MNARQQVGDVSGRISDEICGAAGELPDPDVALREWRKVSLAAAHEQHRAAATSLGFPWTTHAELHNF